MKTITVRGSGRASAKPDCVVLTLSLESRHPDYGQTMQGAADKIAELNKSLALVGFSKESLKTVDFDVRTEYVSKKDKDGTYRRIFKGYLVSHRLKVTFDFDTVTLTRVLGAVATCVADPELSVAFTVKDPTQISEELLVSAAENARTKAEVLCRASGVKLGELVNISYSWGELDVYSHTRYELDDKCKCLPDGAPDIEIDPDDIRVSDTVNFVWQIA